MTFKPKFIKFVMESEPDVSATARIIYIAENQCLIFGILHLSSILKTNFSNS